MSATIYNGSAPCRGPGCKHILTPLESMYTALCPSCTAALVRQLREGKMVAGTDIINRPGND